MFWLARSLAKARGETQPFIGMFLRAKVEAMEEFTGVA